MYYERKKQNFIEIGATANNIVNYRKLKNNTTQYSS